ncbi:UDP-glucose 4-epimerase family protein [Neptuniibacter sp. QD48_11]|uniref:UDP-glucose 4-epimerase family protein n=1 Tax=Neptuniibacter sp. QD48_11 TaxID=3398211 RepID=UPI0039F517E3
MSDKLNVLVTGGSGFVGNGLLDRLSRSDECEVLAATRSGFLAYPSIRLSDFTGETDWSDALSGIDVVIHAAARVHLMEDNEVNPLEAYRLVNVKATMNLAKQAVQAGVKRFIFISTIKVNGENTNLANNITADDHPCPQDFYSQSKWEAEKNLLSLSRDTGIEVVIIRPPLVYGPNVKGNFKSLINILRKGIPLPLGAITNKRSLVSLENLVDLIVVCIDHPKAANEVFLVSDGEDISTTVLLEKVSKCMGIRSRLIPVPVVFLRIIATLIGKKQLADRLLGSLQVDISKTRLLLGWNPPLTLDEGLALSIKNEIG